MLGSSSVAKNGLWCVWFAPLMFLESILKGVLSPTVLFLNGVDTLSLMFLKVAVLGALIWFDPGDPLLTDRNIDVSILFSTGEFIDC